MHMHLRNPTMFQDEQGQTLITFFKNADAYASQRHAGAMLFSREYDLMPGNLRVHATAAADLSAGVLHPIIAVQNLGGNASNELEWLMMLRPNVLHFARNEIHAEFVPVKGQRRRTKDFAEGSVLTLYTDRLAIDPEVIIRKFDEVGMSVDIVSEEELHQTVFISYGGPDQPFVNRINQFLVSHGVKTWYFPVNKLPGQKLHRMMSEGVKTHDRVLVVCSKNSLSRNGVLNEIERVLEREAREGGSEILIPLTIDDHLFSEAFRPAHLDADQIKSRVA